LSRPRGLHPNLAYGLRELQYVARLNGIRLTVTSGRRSYRTQWRLYRRYLLGQSKYPAAVPGTSKHEKGLAFDIAVSPEWALDPLGRLWESWGGRWGGRFRDPIHFEI
jgi:LAS superfamily LD-carboxypeptidase LdcB